MAKQSRLMQILNEEGFKTSTGKMYTPKGASKKSGGIHQRAADKVRSAEPKKEKRAARVLRETKELQAARKKRNAKATPKANGGLFKRAADKLSAARSREEDKKGTGRSTATRPTPSPAPSRRPAPSPAPSRRPAPSPAPSPRPKPKGNQVDDRKSKSGVEGKPMPSNPPGQFQRRGLPPNQARVKGGGVVQGNSGRRRPPMDNKQLRVGDTFKKNGVNYAWNGKKWVKLKGNPTGRK